MSYPVLAVKYRDGREEQVQTFLADLVRVESVTGKSQAMWPEGSFEYLTRIAHVALRRSKPDTPETVDDFLDLVDDLDVVTPEDAGKV